jgi:thioredoxin-like negative regulator of GroEL
VLLGLGLLVALASASGLDAARTLLDEGRYADALKAFKSAQSDSHGRCAPCLLGMAEAQMGLGEPGDAASSAATALSLGLGNGALTSRAESVRGIALLKEGRADALERAEAAFRGALAADATNVRARFNLGYVLLRQGRDAEGLVELRQYLAGEPSGGPSEQARWLLEKPRRARERFAPDFETRTLTGDAFSLKGLRGRVVLLDFWATWCGPCRDALPELKELTTRYPRDRFAIVSISVDDEVEPVRAFVAKHGATWIQIHDAEGALQERFGVEVLPSYLLVDGEGVIRKELTGTDDQRSLGSRLREMLASLPELATP